MFSVRKTTADLALEPFPFEGSDGVIYELPNLRGVSLDLANRVMDGDFLGVLGELNTERATVREVNSLPLAVLEPLVKAWVEHAGFGEGESAASSRSSASTAGPSKQTSPATTASRTRRR